MRLVQDVVRRAQREGRAQDGTAMAAASDPVLTAVQRDAASGAAAAADAIDAAVPSDLADQLNTIRDRLDALEP